MQKKICNLVFRHLDELYQIAERLCKDPGRAEDLTHDLFLHLESSYKNQIHDVQNPKAWLTSIMYRLYIDNWRREKRYPVINQNNLAEETAADFGPLETCINDESQKTLLDTINSLSEDYRDVVVLHDIEGFKLAELEEILNAPLGTLKSRLHRARRILQKKLNQQQIDHDTHTNESTK